MLDPVLRSFARDLANCRLFRPDGQLPKLGRLARACARAQQCVAVPARLHSNYAGGSKDYLQLERNGLLMQEGRLKRTVADADTTKLKLGKRWRRG